MLAPRFLFFPREFTPQGDLSWPPTPWASAPCELEVREIAKREIHKINTTLGDARLLRRGPETTMYIDMASTCSAPDNCTVASPKTLPSTFGGQVGKLIVGALSQFGHAQPGAERLDDSTHILRQEFG